METTGKDALLRMKTKVGTAFFMAPEVIKKDYSNSWDMWSAGWILYVMLSGYPPFDGDSEKKRFLMQLKKGSLILMTLSGRMSLMRLKCLLASYFEVKNIECLLNKALKHPWIKNNIEKESGKMLSTVHMTRLKNFHNKKKLRQTVLTFLASRVTDEEIAEQTKLFQELDSNNDGYITLKELSKGLQDKMKPDEIQAIMDSVDTDKNGAINYNEFIAATLEPSITQDIARVEQAFKFFDEDGNGFIDGKELKKILGGEELRHLETKAFENILKEADEDGNGKIDVKEFMKLMSIKPK